MKLSNELTRKITAHIEEVRKHLNDFPADERQEILQSIKAHIYDALEIKGGDEPSAALLEAVLAEMDPPESYGERPPTKQLGSVMKQFVSAALILTAIIVIWVTFGISKGNTPAQTITSAETKSPPIVVSTFPLKGDNDVDPTITELRVTFNKDMLTDRMWSWCIESQDTAPKFVSEGTKFIDKRTCVTPVELEPNKTYVVWINTQKHDAFRDIYHNPSVPYRLEFRTSNATFNPHSLPAKQTLTDRTSDPAGRWVSVDFVSSVEQFDPEIKKWRGDLALKAITFLPDGKTDRPYWTWADGILHHSGDNTDAKLLIKKISGEEYLFLEWISGDVVYGGLPAKYYVLKQSSLEPADTSKLKPVVFEQGHNTLKDGDYIILDEVLATSPHFAEGDTVTVKGRYTLSSQLSARLSLFVTGTRGRGICPVAKEQQVIATQGTGEFVLTTTIPYYGCAHLTFYDEAKGTTIGGLYFGTKEQVEEIEGIKSR